MNPHTDRNTNPRCPRCQGCITTETNSVPDQMAPLVQLRCVNCGYRAEPQHRPDTRVRVIATTHRRMQEPLA